MIKSFLYFSFLLIVMESSAQSNPSPSSDKIKLYRKEWANFGVGVSSDKVFNSIEALNLGLSYHWLPKRITYQAGFSATSKIGGGSSVNSLHAGIGKTKAAKLFLVSLIAGPGLMWGRKYENENTTETHFVKIGLAATAAIILKPLNNFGIGIELFTNVNEAQNASGIRILVHLNNDKIY